ncbi:hypothetical protein ACS0TY_010128 [Phlomoides rotata]
MVFSTLLRVLTLLGLFVFCPLSGFMDAMLDKLFMSVEEDDELVLDANLRNMTAPKTMKFCLVVHFLTELPINFNLMKNCMTTIWRPKKGLYVKDICDGRFKYEKLNQFYFICGHLGHTENFYEVVFNAPDGEEIKHEWGSWLKVPGRRFIFSTRDKWLCSDLGGPTGDILA